LVPSCFLINKKIDFAVLIRNFENQTRVNNIKLIHRNVVKAGPVLPSEAEINLSCIFKSNIIIIIKLTGGIKMVKTNLIIVLLKNRVCVVIELLNVFVL
jgi:hypothetical protein